MRKLTAFVIALLLGMGAAVVVDGRTARADTGADLAALLFPMSAYPEITRVYTRALYALNHGNRAAYERYKDRLETMVINSLYWANSSRANLARRLHNDLPAFDRVNVPDYSSDLGG